MKSTAPNTEDLEVLIERLLLTQRQLNEVDVVIEPLITEQEAATEFSTVIEYGDKVIASLTRLKSTAKRSTEGTNVGSTNSNENRTRTRGTAAKIKTRTEAPEV